MRVGEHLKKPTRLVLIGSSVGMFYGQSGRMTEDIDCWGPKSQVDLADITQACRETGLEFDPQGFDVSGVGLYLQMVKSGIVHVGKWDGAQSEEAMFTSGNLTVTHPPVANIIASKMVRCSDADISDSVFLMKRFQVDLDAVSKVLTTMSHQAGEMASENMVLLEIHVDIAKQVQGFDSRRGHELPNDESGKSTEKPEVVSTPRRRRP